MSGWDEAQEWFRKAHRVREETHMVIAVDTFDGEAFPSYTDDPAMTVKSLRDNLNQVMEVYDLRKPLDGQHMIATVVGLRAWDMP